MFNSVHPCILAVSQCSGRSSLRPPFAVLRSGPDNNQKAASGCMTSSALSRSPRSLLSGLQAILSISLAEYFTGPTAPPDRDRDMYVFCQGLFSSVVLSSCVFTGTDLTYCWNFLVLIPNVITSKILITKHVV